MCLETLQNKCKKDNKEEEREREREYCLGITRKPFWSFNYKRITKSYCQLGATTKNS